MDAVPYTAELCEMIVLPLSGTNIINCMRVSRAFKATIDASQKVKRKLFLVAEPDSEYVWHIDRNNGQIRVATLASVAYLTLAPFVLLRLSLIHI